MDKIAPCKMHHACAMQALTVEDVNAGVARAVDHADRRADNIMKSIGGACNSHLVSVFCTLYGLFLAFASALVAIRTIRRQARSFLLWVVAWYMDVVTHVVHVVIHCLTASCRCRPRHLHR